MSTRVEVAGLAYSYPTSRRGDGRLLDLLMRRSRPAPRDPVLRDVSFRVEAGSCLGVIGANGAGKSTLLKLMVGALRPDRGTVDVDGRIAPIIGLGSGLHPEFDADENVLLMGTAMGNPLKDVRRRLDEIIGYADLEEHRHEPVRRYSSGMLARLAFSVATAFRPDVLLLDEVLGVGDYDFSTKAKLRIEDLIHGDAATILVSHDIASICNLCDQALWLDQGKVAAHGDPGEVVAAYVEDWKAKRAQEGR